MILSNVVNISSIDPVTTSYFPPRSPHLDLLAPAIGPFFSSHCCQEEGKTKQ